jgi:hypothetical protein
MIVELHERYSRYPDLTPGRLYWSFGIEAGMSGSRTPGETLTIP